MLQVTRSSGLAPVWEKKLAKYGLSMAQICLSEKNIQLVNGGTMQDHPALQAHAFDKDIDSHWKARFAAQRVLSSQEITRGFHRVPARPLTRKTPTWAFNDVKCKALLLALYPSLNKTSGNAYLRQCYKGTRARAARCWFALYMAFRMGMTDAEIAEQLHVGVTAVAALLYRVRCKGDALFTKN